MYVVGTLILLAGLPLLVSRYVGPVRPGWAPRLMRVGGYAVVLALIAATAVQQRIGSQLGAYFPVVLPVWAMDVGFLLILTGYVTGLLILTSRRVRFTRRVLPTRAGHRGADGRAALRAGTLRHQRHGRDGRPLPARRPRGRRRTTWCSPASRWPRWPSPWPCTPSLPAWPTATLDPAPSPRPGRPCWPPPAPWRTAAILVALFTTLTIALSPYHFTGAQQPAGDGICPTCEPSTIVVPTNLRHEYSFEATVNGAGDGATALLVVPLIGAALGALRGHLRYPPPATRPVGLPGRG